MDGLHKFLEKYISKDSLFIDKKILQPSHFPDIILHRESEINQIANTLAPCLKLEKPSNLFVYGKTGTGKTLCVKYVVDHIQSISSKRNIPLKIIYINCKLKKIADTEYRLVANLCREFGKDVPSTGLPTEEIYSIFFKAVDTKEQQVIIVLDEVDQLVKKAGDEILYNLVRINTELAKSQIVLVGISNNVVFADHLDPRVRSSLSEEEMIFSPYNAPQLQAILGERAKKAFKQDVVEEGLIGKCAAYAARDHGDARRAIDLLRVAAELAERANKTKITIADLDVAEEKIERDKVLEIIMTQPKQHQIVLLAIISTQKKQNEVFTGDIYQLYSVFCSKIGVRPLTQRRVSDIILELAMYGVVDTRVISKGRYGRSKEVKKTISESSMPQIKKIIMESLGLQ